MKFIVITGLIVAASAAAVPGQQWNQWECPTSTVWQTTTEYEWKTTTEGVPTTAYSTVWQTETETESKQISGHFP